MYIYIYLNLQGLGYKSQVTVKKSLPFTVPCHRSNRTNVHSPPADTRCGGSAGLLLDQSASCCSGNLRQDLANVV